MSVRWSTPDDIAVKVRRRWEDGTLLRAYAGAAAFDEIEIPLRGPKPSEIGGDLGAVQEWIAKLDAGRRDNQRYELAWQAIGGRYIGRNKVPIRAIVRTYEQAWAVLGTQREVADFDGLLAAVAGHDGVRAWAVANPRRALTLKDEIQPLIEAYEWLDAHRDSGLYLREISAPGVDTKFAEKHRAVLAAMLGVPTTAAGFTSALGLRAKAGLVRVRPASSLALPSPLTELAIRADELADISVKPRIAVVLENEITYLSVGVPEDGIVIWGKGFDIDKVGRLPWLVEADVVYWGDIDTHGFAILNRFRAWLPQVRSILMDSETLLAHRDRWVTEERPARSSLQHLTQDEQALYGDLVADIHGQRIRLEQERVDWSWAEQRLAVAVGERLR